MVTLVHTWWWGGPREKWMATNAGMDHREPVELSTLVQQREPIARIPDDHFVEFSVRAEQRAQSPTHS